MIRMHHSLRYFAISLAMLATVAPCHANNRMYSGDAIEAWIVDADTGEPVEGAIVVAHWMLKGGFEGGTPVGMLQLLESETDGNGRFYFPAWGPKQTSDGHLGFGAPEVLIFKSGYTAQLLGNDHLPASDHLKSSLNGKTIKLKRFTGTTPEYASHLYRTINDTLWVVYRTAASPCAWQLFPGMLRAMHDQNMQWRKAGEHHITIWSVLRRERTALRNAQCGLPSDLDHD